MWFFSMVSWDDVFWEIPRGWWNEQMKKMNIDDGYGWWWGWGWGWCWYWWWLINYADESFSMNEVGGSASVEVIADNYAMIEAILPIPKKPSTIPNAKPPITENLHRGNKKIKTSKFTQFERKNRSFRPSIFSGLNYNISPTEISLKKNYLPKRYQNWGFWSCFRSRNNLTRFLGSSR